MKSLRLLVLLSLSLCGVGVAADAPTKDDFARCVEIAEVVFKNESDRDPQMLGKYYAPSFRALLEKGVAAESGEAPFLDADFLRMTQDVFPKIAKVGPATSKDGRIQVPVLLRYAPDSARTNTAVFERVGNQWMICDLVSDDGSLAAQLGQEFGEKR